MLNANKETSPGVMGDVASSLLSRGELDSLLEQKRSLDALVESWHSIFSQDDRDADFSLDGWDIEGDEVCLSGTRSGCGRGCCPPEGASYRFPLEWLHHRAPSTVEALQAWRRQWELEQSLPRPDASPSKERL